MSLLHPSNVTASFSRDCIDTECVSIVWPKHSSECRYSRYEDAKRRSFDEQICLRDHVRGIIR
ncbi:hypothetical protein CSUI_007213 [Cystoisospora suis]|uniref:Uncharacterized protein n=1 Tax=Cystoisospora suis TaxID=483139 RepID=A0A2C6KRD0_9APIC|nr:hypothetical protein CSUI_007213 [Cystoisospora suis]